MDRIPLSDEFDPDDEVIEEEGTTGPEEQYEDLDFSFETDPRFELEPWDTDDDFWEGDE